MIDLLPMFFIVLGALALIVTLFWLWQSLREAVVDAGPLLAGASNGAGGRASQVSSERADLLAEKKALLLALKDLQAERDAGKLSEEDFDEFNTRYRARAREVLQALDAQVGPYREQARKLIASVSQTPAEQVVHIPAEQPAALRGAAARTPAAAAVSATEEHACKSCGVKNDGDAVFCKKCGARIAEESRA